jgi:hypothetical protein
MCPLNAPKRASTRLRSFCAAATCYSFRLGMPRTCYCDVSLSSPRPYPESECSGDHVPLVSARLALLLPRPRVTHAREQTLHAHLCAEQHTCSMHARAAACTGGGGRCCRREFYGRSVVKPRGSGRNVRCTHRSHALACAEPHTAGPLRCVGDVAPA